MKTIYGLFPSHRDALGAFDELARAGFDQADMSAVLQAGSINAKPGSQPAGGPDRRAAGQAHRSRMQPAPDARREPYLPGGRRIRVPGGPSLLASGRLAAAFGRVDEATKDQPANLKSVLAGAGLPAAFVENYSRGVGSGQTLLAVRTPDDRERDAVMIMRRHRVISLGGLPE